MDEKWMKQAIELAKRGKNVKTNPKVGAVIVKDQRVIGMGYHDVYGGPHAEILALTSAEETVEGATMYVTLEPCSHQGKTPPCTRALIQAGIKRVVIGMQDPNALVAGSGVRILREAGIQVDVGICETEVQALNKYFIYSIKHSKPYVVYKSAMSLDGKTALSSGESKWITSESSRAYVHQLRAAHDGIMVGIGTVLMDDPQLTNRSGKGKNPLRIIVDTQGRIPLTAKVLDHQAETLVVTAKMAKDKADLIRRNHHVLYVSEDQGQVDLDAMMKGLYIMGLKSLLLEGGPNLGFGMLSSGHIQAIKFFYAPKLFGGREAKTSLEGQGIRHMEQHYQLASLSYRQIGVDLLVEGEVKTCSQAS